jgi:hypothetical protein
LHVACRHGASREVLRCLVERDPATAGVWHTTSTPRHSSLVTSAVKILWEHREHTESNKVQENYDSLFWHKVHVLLAAVARARQGPSRTHHNRHQHHHHHPTTMAVEEDLYIVHAAVSLGAVACPRPILQYALTMFPKQVQMRDPRGQLPLHIAVRIPKSTQSRRLDRSTVSVMSLLLHLYPLAAREIDWKHEPSGRYPLHTALMHRYGWYDGVQHLFLYAPEVVQLRDPLMKHLYPYQIASLPPMTDPITINTTTSSSSSTNTNDEPSNRTVSTWFDLDTVYHLLRAQPSVLESLARVASPNSPTPPRSQATRRFSLNAYMQSLASSPSMSSSPMSVASSATWWKARRRGPMSSQNSSSYTHMGE